ncbi:MAG: polysaccharide biosynthesis protein [Burkholderiales bacterium]|nr:polysaccharide biosynthesis protein [Burkholderiales bacterium]
MNIRWNVVANYVGQGYSTLIAIVMLPFYLKHLGAEAYGLVGFFAMLQAWFALLDMGLSPTLSRQMAHKRGQAVSGWGELRKLLRSIEVLFMLLAFVIGLGIWLSSDWIATRWLTVQTLSHDEVAYCITLMGIMFGMRWFASLYRGGVQGMERMVWLNAVTIVLATLRFVGVYALLLWVTQKPRHFFEFQLAISVIELWILAAKLYRLTPHRTDAGEVWFSWSALNAVLPFASGIAYTSGLWILLTQVDKLILSHALPLKEFGYFTLVAVVANGLLSLTGPVKQAILPRMTLLLSRGDAPAMLDLYRKSTLVVAGVIFPITGTVAIFSTELLYAWTGDKAAADWAGPVLKWFVLGNGILAIAAFPYYLQFAYGRIRLHVINSTINAVIQVPILAFAAYQYGALGVAYAWFGVRLFGFLIFPAIVHHQLVPGFHKKWLLRDVLTPALVTGVVIGMAWRVLRIEGDWSRLEMLVAIATMVMVTCLFNFVAMLYSSKLWKMRLSNGQ